MHALGSRHRTARAATYCVIATAALVAVRNATVYPAVLGYDAQEALDYAEGLVEHGRLPEGTGSYYTPPGFFAVAGVGLEVSDRLGLDHRERAAQIFNALAAAGTLVLLLVLLRLLWPGRDVLHLAAVVFCAVCPVVMKAAAMVHPEPLSMLLSTGALVLAARLLVRSDHRLVTPSRSARASGSRSSCGRGRSGPSASSSPCSSSRRPPVWASAVASGSRPRSRSSSRCSFPLRGTPTSWRATTARSSAARPPRSRSGRGGRSRSSSAPACRRSSRPVPAVVRQPLRPRGLRGDLGRLLRRLAMVPSGGGPTSSVRRELTTMSLVGLPFTVTALAGWLALLGLAIRHPGRGPSGSSSPSSRSAPSPAPSTSRPPTRRRTGTR